MLSRWGQAGLGFLIAGSGQLIGTFDAAFVRLASTSSQIWVVIFWRFISIGVLLTLPLLCVHRRDLCGLLSKAGDTFSIAAAASIGACQLSYTASIQMMAAANTIVIFATCPILTALMSRFVLAEPVPRQVIFVALIAFLSVFLIFCSGLRAASAAAYFLALVAALSMASYSTICYQVSLKDPTRSMMPALALAAFSSATIALIASKGDVAVEWEAFGWSVAQGLEVPLWIGALTVSTNFIKPAEANMVLFLDPIIAPVWVWMAGFEEPPKYTMIGAVGLACALLLHGRWTILRIAEEEQPRELSTSLSPA